MHVAKKAKKGAEQKSLWLDYKKSRNNTNASVKQKNGCSYQASVTNETTEIAR